MEKRKYVKPVLSGEEFVPQNYCAACGENNVLYKFTCDAAGGPLYYFPNIPANLTKPTEGSEGYYIGSYNPCEAYHEAQAKNGFYWGYVDKRRGNGYDKKYNGILDNDELVIVWRGENGRNGHATTKLNMDEWETLKS